MSSSRRRPDGPATKPKLPKSSKKGAGLGGGESPNPLTIHDHSQAFEAGVEAEEKGERFAISFKAMRRYQEAAALYLRAMELRPDSADAAYNAARVHFLLATSFYPPPLSIKALTTSIDLYRKALLHAPPPSLVDAEQGLMLDQAFSLDVRYNLGMALESLGELLDQVSSGSKARETLVAAVETLQQTAVGQEEVLAYRRRMQQVGHLPVAPQDQEANGGHEATPSVEGAGDDDAMETQGDEEEDDDASPSDFVASVVTPASTLETLMSMHSTLLNLLANTSPTSPAPSLEEVLSLASQARSRGQSIVQLYPDGSASNEDDRLEWTEAVHELRLANLNAGVMEACKRAELASEGSPPQVWPTSESQEEKVLRELEDDVVRQATAELEASTTPSSSTPQQGPTSTAASEASSRRHVQLLCDLADGLFSLSKLRIRQFQLSLRLGSNLGQPSALTSRAWDLAARSSKLYLAALSRLSGGASGGPTTLSISTTATSTPLTRAKSNINTSLVHLSLFRCSSPFLLSSPRLNEKVAKTLRDNAMVYAKRGLTEVGLAWMYQEDGESKIPSKAKSQNLAHGAWDSMRGEADALLGLVRACLKARTTANVAGTEDPEQQVQVGKTLRLLTMSVRALVRRGDTFQTALLGEVPFGEVWTCALDLRRFGGEEGEVGRIMKGNLGGYGGEEGGSGTPTLPLPLQRLLEEVEEGLGVGMRVLGKESGDTPLDAQEPSSEQDPTGHAIWRSREELTTELDLWKAWIDKVAAGNASD